MVGNTIGNYRVMARIARGGMGDVFLAEHQRIARRAAIKVLHRDIVHDPQMLARFFDEAKSTSLIKNDGIVEIYDVDVAADGRAYIVMEYLQGETLAARLRRHARLAWTDACNIARQIAVAVGAAHAKGIVHRDLKPDNIFLVADQLGGSSMTVKVLDFGIAKLLEGNPARPYHTAPGALVGTPEYMSPEQCCGLGWIDQRADIYALGCVLFKMIRGRAPFVSPRTREVIAAQMFEEPPPLDDTGKLAPPWLHDTVAWMLAKQPTDRPQSMSVVAKEMSRGPGFWHPAWASLWRPWRSPKQQRPSHS
ncbi:MAG TPA: serine/threonine-protein kinase [Polyangia bacterium]|jgi:serine/threonine-protein kinase|nr:serine/threonine-protein kinase [Polyangia bacterium]